MKPSSSASEARHRHGSAVPGAPPPLSCDLCKKAIASIKRCGKCRVAAYCSRDCQVKHWKVHKRDCGRLGGLRVAGGSVTSRGVGGRRRPTNGNSYYHYAKQTLLLAYLAWSFYTLYKLMNPTINVKTGAEVDELRDACRDASDLLLYLDPYVRPGATTASLDSLASQWAAERGLVSAPLNYGGFGLTFDSLGKHVCGFTNSLAHSFLTTLSFLSMSGSRGFAVGIPFCGFPASVCISVNEEVCHGIPSDSRVLKPCDLVNVDVTVINSYGMHGDTSRMWIVGGGYGGDGGGRRLEDLRVEEAEGEKERLAVVARECLFHGIKAVKAGANIREIGRAIQAHADRHGYSLVREYSGHGIGKSFHEGPRILHYDAPSMDTVLRPGVAITIEPMLNAGGRDVLALEDQWTIVTKDGSPSAQWEHTIVGESRAFESGGAGHLNIQLIRDSPLPTRRSHGDGGRNFDHEGGGKLARVCPRRRRYGTCLRRRSSLSCVCN